MEIDKMSTYASEEAVVMVNSFLSCSIVRAGCWYSTRYPIDSVSSWKK